MAYGFGFGALALLPFQFINTLSGARTPWPVPLETWRWFAGLVLLASILPFGLYLVALRRLPVSVASIVAASEVVFGSFIGYLFFGETLSRWQVLGAVLVIAGVVLIATRDGERQAAGD